MTSTENKTVARMVAENPAWIRVFERHQIDYCCGGNRDFEEVCRERELSPSRLAAELSEMQAPAEERDWSEARLGELIEHIVGRHHAYLRSALPPIAEKLQKVIAAHPDYRETIAEIERVFQGLVSELTQHMMKEEMILFPLIRGMEEAEQLGATAPPSHCGSVNNPIRVMVHEHDNAGNALQAMRSLSSDYRLPPEACNTFTALYAQLQELEADLHLHIHLENNILFPKAGGMEERLLAGAA